MTLIRETRQSRLCVRESDVVTHSPWGDDPTWRMAYFSTKVGWARNCQQVMPSMHWIFFAPHPMLIWESWCVVIGISCFQEFSICAFSYVGDWCWWLTFNEDAPSTWFPPTRQPGIWYFKLRHVRLQHWITRDFAGDAILHVILRHSSADEGWIGWMMGRTHQVFQEKAHQSSSCTTSNQYFRFANPKAQTHMDLQIMVWSLDVSFQIRHIQSKFQESNFQ